MATRKTSDWISSYLKYTERSEPPTSYKEWVAISVIASVLQRKCFLNWGELVFYPNMYVVLVGPSGKCRKGTAMGVGASILREIGIKMTAEAITREALIRDLSKSADTISDPNTGKTVLHSSLTIFSQELTVFLGYNNSQLLSDLTDWYDCRERWTYRTKNMGEDDIIGVWVNLIGATTPELIQSTLPRDAIGGGLSSRIIFVYEDKKSKSVPTPFLTKEDMELREDLLHDLEQISMISGPFEVTDQFVTRWIDWYMAHEKTPRFTDQRFAGYVERRPNHIMKLCIILSASERNDRVVTKEILDRAIDLLERTERKMQNVFSGYGQSSSADVMNRVMVLIGREGEITREEIMNQLYYDLEDSKHLDRILQSLEAMNYCRVIIADKGVVRVKYVKSDVNDARGFN